MIDRGAMRRPSRTHQIPHADHVISSIPKGLNHSARGCEERATPGTRTENIINPEGVEWGA